MSIKRRALVVIALVVVGVWVWGFLDFAHHSRADHGPSAQQLTDTSNRIVDLGHIKATKPHFVDRGTWYYVERDVINPTLDRTEMNALAKSLRPDGWVPGRTTDDEKLILCKGDVVLQIVAPASQASGFRGSITVSWGWGDASTQCREKSPAGSS
jgi:hypothetical protein